MRDLLILGVGVHAGEMAEIVERVDQAAPTWKLLGFVAPAKAADRVGQAFNGYPVVGTPEVLARYPEAAVVPDNEFKDAVDLPRDRWATLTDPSSFISRTATIGAGCVIYPNCFVGLNARLGDRVFMLSGVVVNHDDRVEAGVVMASHVTLAGFVTVEAGAYLGQGCQVRQFLRVGHGSLVGMGSVVVRDVPPETVVAGNPARRLRDRAL